MEACVRIETRTESVEWKQSTWHEHTHGNRSRQYIGKFAGHASWSADIRQMRLWKDRLALAGCADHPPKRLRAVLTRNDQIDLAQPDSWNLHHQWEPNRSFRALECVRTWINCRRFALHSRLPPLHLPSQPRRALPSPHLRSALRTTGPEGRETQAEAGSSGRRASSSPRAGSRQAATL